MKSSLFYCKETHRGVGWCIVLCVRVLIGKWTSLTNIFVNFCVVYTMKHMATSHTDTAQWSNSIMIEKTL